MDDGLAGRIHALPAEIFNDILDLVLEADTQNTVTIDRAYKPPVQLQISRATRITFAGTYYGNTTFIAARGSVAIFAAFLKSLPQDHALSIRHLHYAMSPSPCCGSDLRARQTLRCCSGSLENRLSKLGASGLLHSEMRFSMKVKIEGKNEEKTFDLKYEQRLRSGRS